MVREPFLPTAPILVFPTSCSGLCEPVWTKETEESGAVAGDGEHLFVYTGGAIEAYPLVCSQPCQPDWRAAVGDGDPGRCVSRCDSSPGITDA